MTAEKEDEIRWGKVDENVFEVEQNRKQRRAGQQIVLPHI